MSLKKGRGPRINGRGTPMGNWYTNMYYVPSPVKRLYLDADGVVREYGMIGPKRPPRFTKKET
jgi:hypothetical protein